MDRQRLKALIRERSLRVSDQPVFKLSSGRLSRYYIDLKQVTFDPEGVYLLGRVLYESLRELKPDGVG
ncbi:MAG: orotate phosphoribosyltransferase, partial [Aquificota bacterium]